MRKEREVEDNYGAEIEREKEIGRKKRETEEELSHDPSKQPREFHIAVTLLLALFHCAINFNILI